MWSTWGLTIPPNISFFHLFLPLSVLIWSCAVLYAGPRLASGTAGFTIRQKLDGGEWKRCVPESEESAAFKPRSPTSPPALKQIAPAGIRSDSLSAARWKKTRCFAKRNFNLWILFVRGFVYLFPIALQEWIPFQFPWKTTAKCTRALKRVRPKFVVTGELAMLKHLKAAAAGNTATHNLSYIFHSYQCILSLSIVLDATFLQRMVS